MSLPSFKLITSPAAWHNCLSQLRHQPRLAIDLESNSMFVYQEQVCLIQISIPGADYIIDPLAPLDLEPLGQLVADNGVQKVFHAAEYDLILMKRQYGWEISNLFDTMWAVRILGYRQVGLANVLESKFGVQLNKRYQRSNWCARPLSNDQLSYAQSDTHYLLLLADMLTEELTKAGRLAEAEEIFAEQSTIRLNDNAFDPDGFWSINGVRDLPPASQAVLKALFIYRDEEARRRNRPPFKIFGNKSMLAVAEALPRHTHELYGLHGMSSGQVRRYGRRFVQIVRDNENAPAPPRPQRSDRPPDDIYDRYETLHNWRKKRARKRGVESDVILSRETLWRLAHINPQSEAELAAVEGLGPVRRRLYGKEILATLRLTD